MNGKFDEVCGGARVREASLTVPYRYVAPTIDPDQLRIKSYENSALFLISSFQYIIVAAVFCVGPPYRQPVHANVPLTLTLVALTAFSTYILFVRHGPVYHLLQLRHLPHDFNLELTLLVMANAMASWAWERHGAAVVAIQVGRLTRRWRRWRGVTSTSRMRGDGKAYRAIERDMDDD